MKYAGLIALLALGACEDVPQPRTLEEVQQTFDWAGAPGSELNRSFDHAIQRILTPMSRPDAIAAIEAADYACIFGEAHADHPEPAVQCTRSFATRACQMDWEIFLTADPKKPSKIDDVGGSYTRDCVGTADDWPEPKASAIDDQLAPPPAN